MREVLNRRIQYQQLNGLKIVEYQYQYPATPSDISSASATEHVVTPQRPADMRGTVNRCDLGIA